MNVKPEVVCPKCHARVALRALDDAPTCPQCGVFKPIDPHYRWRAFGRASESLLAPTSEPKPWRAATLARCDLGGDAAIELIEGEVSRDDVGPDLPAPEVVAALGAVVPLLIDAAKLREVGTLVALRVAPEVAARLADGTANWLERGGEKLATIVDAKGAFLANASWAPATLGAFGAAAAWQALSIAVAQKHLHDINVRLEQIDRKLDAILNELAQKAQDQLRADARKLQDIARAITKKSPTEESRREKRSDVRRHLDEARTRHEELSRKVLAHADTLERSKANWLGQTLNTAAKKSIEHVTEFHQRLMSVYGNLLVETVALHLLVALGEDTAFTETVLESVQQDLEKTDDLARRYDTGLAVILPGMTGIMRGEEAEARARGSVAFAEWQAVERHVAAVAPLRRLLAEFRSPQLCAELGADHAVTSVRLLRAGRSGAG